MTAGIRYHWWWRPGWRPGARLYTFHFTFADQPAVQELAAKARASLAPVAWLDLVPGEWLHCTTQGVGFSQDVSVDDLAAITDAARSRLADVPPAVVTVGAPKAVGEGAVCWVGPDGALDPARDALRAAIGDAWGSTRVPETAEWAPHVSVAYANADGPTALVDDALGEGWGVMVTLRRVDLISLGRDNRVYEWETIASIPLGG
jgi:2'-5' RNA ligase superfamily